MEAISTRGEKPCSTPSTTRDISLYRSCLPGTKIPCGHKRFASLMGMAECTPNLRAS